MLNEKALNSKNNKDDDSHGNTKDNDSNPKLYAIFSQSLCITGRIVGSDQISTPYSSINLVYNNYITKLLLCSRSFAIMKRDNETKILCNKNKRAKEYTNNNNNKVKFIQGNLVNTTSVAINKGPV